MNKTNYRAPRGSILAGFRRKGAYPALLAAALSVATPAFAQSLPTGGQVAAGAATISQPNANSLQVNQTTQNAILNWQSFSIGAGNSVVFQQPGASSVALNRVLGNSASQIFGSLTSNGQIFLVNPSGVLFGPSASVSVGGIAASTLGISDADFLAGRYSFSNGGSAGSVVNQGNITTLSGYAALVGPQVSNTGVINARMGTVALAAGNAVTLDMVGDGLINVRVDLAAVNASAINQGTITADGGNVLLTARSANALLDTVVSNDGVIRANAISQRGGSIYLDGGPTGVTSVSGSLEASGLGAGQTGGNITVLGDRVGLFGSASLNASGDAGGGTILIGGNFQGKGPEANASRTFVSSAARIAADAITIGNGGKIIVWSNDATYFGGQISARGGNTAGNGGFVEVSGKGFLSFTGTADRRAPNGVAGTLLLDPTDLTINAAGPSTAEFAVCAVGGCGALVETTSVLSTADLAAALTGGSVNVNATAGTGTGGGTINWTDGAVNASANSLTLTGSSITFNGTLTNVANFIFVGALQTSTGTATSSTGGAITGLGNNTFTLSNTQVGTASGITFNSFGSADAKVVAGASDFNDATKTTRGMTFASATTVSGTGAITGIGAGTFTLTGTTAGTTAQITGGYSGFTTADAQVVAGAQGFNDAQRSSLGMSFASATTVSGTGAITGMTGQTFTLTGTTAGTTAQITGGYSGFTAADATTVAGAQSFNNANRSSLGMTFASVSTVSGTGAITGMSGQTFTLTGTTAGTTTNVAGGYSGFTTADATTVAGAQGFNDAQRSSLGMSFASATTVSGTGAITGIGAGTFTLTGTTAGTTAQITGGYSGFTTADAQVVAGAQGFNDAQRSSLGMSFASATTVSGTGAITGMTGQTFTLTGTTAGTTAQITGGYSGFTAADATTVAGAQSFNNANRSSLGMTFASVSTVSGTGAITGMSGQTFTLTGTTAGTTTNVAGGYSGFTTADATTVAGAQGFNDAQRSSLGMSFASATTVSGTGAITGIGAGTFTLTGTTAGTTAQITGGYSGFTTADAQVVAGAQGFNDAQRSSLGMSFASATTVSGTGAITGIGAGTFTLTGTTAGTTAQITGGYSGFTAADAQVVAGAQSFNNANKSSLGMTFAAATTVSGTGTITGMSGQTFTLTGTTAGTTAQITGGYSGFTAADATTVAGAQSFNNANRSSLGMTFASVSTVSGTGAITGMSGQTFTLTGTTAGTTTNVAGGYSGFTTADATTVAGAQGFNDAQRSSLGMSFASATTVSGTGAITGIGAGTFTLTGTTAGTTAQITGGYSGFTTADAQVVAGAQGFNDAQRSSLGMSFASATTVSGTGAITGMTGQTFTLTGTTAGTTAQITGGYSGFTAADATTVAGAQSFNNANRSSLGMTFASVSTVSGTGAITGMSGQTFTLTGTTAGTTANVAGGYSGFTTADATTVAGAQGFNDAQRSSLGMSFASATTVSGTGAITGIGAGTFTLTGTTAGTTAQITGGYSGFTTADAQVVAGAQGFNDAQRSSLGMSFASATTVSGTGAITGIGAGTFTLTGTTAGTTAQITGGYSGFTAADAQVVAGAQSFNNANKSSLGMTFAAATTVSGTGTITGMSGQTFTLTGTTAGTTAQITGGYSGFTAADATTVAGAQSFNNANRSSLGMTFASVSTVSGTGAITGMSGQTFTLTGTTAGTTTNVAGGYSGFTTADATTVAGAQGFNDAQRSSLGMSFASASTVSGTGAITGIGAGTFTLTGTTAGTTAQITGGYSGFTAADAQVVAGAQSFNNANKSSLGMTFAAATTVSGTGTITGMSGQTFTLTGTTAGTTAQIVGGYSGFTAADATTVAGAQSFNNANKSSLGMTFAAATTVSGTGTITGMSGQTFTLTGTTAGTTAQITGGYSGFTAADATTVAGAQSFNNANRSSLGMTFASVSTVSGTGAITGMSGQTFTLTGTTAGTTTNVAGGYSGFTTADATTVAGAQGFNDAQRSSLGMSFASATTVSGTGAITGIGAGTFTLTGTTAGTTAQITGGYSGFTTADAQVVAGAQGFNDAQRSSLGMSFASATTVSGTGTITGMSGQTFTLTGTTAGTTAQITGGYSGFTAADATTVAGAQSFNNANRSSLGMTFASVSTVSGTGAITGMSGQTFTLTGTTAGTTANVAGGYSGFTTADATTVAGAQGFNDAQRSSLGMSFASASTVSGTGAITGIGAGTFTLTGTTAGTTAQITGGYSGFTAADAQVVAGAQSFNNANKSSLGMTFAAATTVSGTGTITGMSGQTFTLTGTTAGTTAQITGGYSGFTAADATTVAGAQSFNNANRSSLGMTFASVSTVSGTGAITGMSGQTFTLTGTTAGTTTNVAGGYSGFTTADATTVAGAQGFNDAQRSSLGMSFASASTVSGTGAITGIGAGTFTLTGTTAGTTAQITGGYSGFTTADAQVVAGAQGFNDAQRSSLGMSFASATTVSGTGAITGIGAGTFTLTGTTAGTTAQIVGGYSGFTAADATTVAGAQSFNNANKSSLGMTFAAATTVSGTGTITGMSGQTFTLTGTTAGTTAQITGGYSGFTAADATTVAGAQSFNNANRSSLGMTFASVSTVSGTGAITGMSGQTFTLTGTTAGTTTNVAGGYSGFTTADATTVAGAQGFNDAQRSSLGMSFASATTVSGTGAITGIGAGTFTLTGTTAGTTAQITGGYSGFTTADAQVVAGAQGFNDAQRSSLGMSFASATTVSGTGTITGMSGQTFTLTGTTAGTTAQITGGYSGFTAADATTVAGAQSFNNANRSSLGMTFASVSTVSGTGAITGMSGQTFTLTGTTAGTTANVAGGYSGFTTADATTVAGAQGFNDAQRSSLGMSFASASTVSGTGAITGIGAGTFTLTGTTAGTTAQITGGYSGFTAADAQVVAGAQSFNNANKSSLGMTFAAATTVSGTGTITGMSGQTFTLTGTTAGTTAQITGGYSGFTAADATTVAGAQSFNNANRSSLGMTFASVSTVSGTGAITGMSGQTFTLTGTTAGTTTNVAGGYSGFTTADATTVAGAQGFNDAQRSSLGMSFASATTVSGTGAITGIGAGTFTLTGTTAGTTAQITGGYSGFTTADAQVVAGAQGFNDAQRSSLGMSFASATTVSGTGAITGIGAGTFTLTGTTAGTTAQITGGYSGFTAADAQVVAGAQSFNNANKSSLGMTFAAATTVSGTGTITGMSGQTFTLTGTTAGTTAQITGGYSGFTAADATTVAGAQSFNNANRSSLGMTFASVSTVSGTGAITGMSGQTFTLTGTTAGTTTNVAGGYSGFTTADATTVAGAQGFNDAQRSSLGMSFASATTVSGTGAITGIGAGTFTLTGTTAGTTAQITGGYSGFTTADAQVVAGAQGFNDAQRSSLGMSFASATTVSGTGAITGMTGQTFTLTGTTAGTTAQITGGYSGFTAADATTVAGAQSFNNANRSSLGMTFASVSTVSGTGAITGMSGQTFTLTGTTAGTTANVAGGYSGFTTADATTVAGAQGFNDAQRSSLGMSFASASTVSGTGAITGIGAGTFTLTGTTAGTTAQITGGYSGFTTADAQVVAGAQGFNDAQRSSLGMSFASATTVSGTGTITGMSGQTFTLTGTTAGTTAQITGGYSGFTAADATTVAGAQSFNNANRSSLGMTFASVSTVSGTGAITGMSGQTFTLTGTTAGTTTNVAGGYSGFTTADATTVAGAQGFNDAQRSSLGMSFASASTVSGTGAITGIGAGTFTLTGTTAGTTAQITGGYSGFTAADAQVVAGAQSFNNANKSSLGMTFAAATTVSGTGTITGMSGQTFTLTGTTAGTTAQIVGGYSGFTAADATTVAGAQGFNDTDKSSLGMTFAAASTVSGTGAITGVVGTFTLTGAASGTTANVTGGYAGFTTLAGNGASTISGASVTYTLDNVTQNSGSGSGYAWSGFANITDTGTGTLNMGTAGSISGTAALGTNGTISYAAYGTPVTFDLNGGAGSTGMAGWSGVTTATGSANVDTITGAGQTYNLTGANAGNNGTVFWTSFENLTATGVSAINGVGGSLTGSLSSAAATTLSGNIGAAGTQTYTGAVTLGGLTTLASTGGGAISFASTVNGGQALTVNTTGTTTFGGAVGNGAALTSLTTDAGGTTAINGGSVRTTGAQSYGDAVTLGSATTLTGVANVFSSSITGTQALTVNDSGNTAYNGPVTVGSLTTDLPGQSNFANGVTVTATGTVVDAATQMITINDPSIGGTNVTLKSNNGGQISINNFTTNTLSVDTAGTVTITGAPGAVLGGNTSGTALQLITVPVNLQVTQASTLVYTAATSPTNRVFATNSSVTAFLGGSTSSIVQAANATAIASSNAVANVQSSVGISTSEAQKAGAQKDAAAEDIQNGTTPSPGTALSLQTSVDAAGGTSMPPEGDPLPSILTPLPVVFTTAAPGSTVELRGTGTVTVNDGIIYLTIISASGVQSAPVKVGTMKCNGKAATADVSAGSAGLTPAGAAAVAAAVSAAGGAGCGG